MIMTAARFKELKADRTLISCQEEEAAFERNLAWEVRSARAKTAVRTKRAKYATWPTRDRKHLLCPKCGTDCGYWNLPLCCGK